MTTNENTPRAASEWEEAREACAKVVDDWNRCKPKPSIDGGGSMRLAPFIKKYGTDNLLEAIRALTRPTPSAPAHAIVAHTPMPPAGDKENA